MTIGDVARQTGIRASALRYYESAGLLAAARRVGGRRVYDTSVLDTLRLIQLAKDAGCHLSHTGAPAWHASSRCSARS